MSKQWSRVINAGQVRREFIDIYYHPRYGHRARQARSERVACGWSRERGREKERSHPRVRFTLGTHVYGAYDFTRVFIDVPYPWHIFVTARTRVSRAFNSSRIRAHVHFRTSF